MKRRAKRRLAALGKGFLIYALMPLICFGCLSVVLVSHRVDLYSVECMAMEFSARELASRLAAAALPVEGEKNDESGAYFHALPEENAHSSPSGSETPLNVTLQIPEGMKPIVKKDLSGGSLFINTTDYELDPDALREQAQLAPVGKEPLVLVLHTHTTEAFYEGESGAEFLDPSGVFDGYYDPQGDSPRSEDPEKSILAVGREFVRVLEEMGIPTLHCTVIHDKDFNSSYSASYRTVTAYLKEYPSLRYVIDIHRDSIVRENGEKIKPVTVIEGKACAQVMLVMGTDESGYAHPQWRTNMGNALLYKDTMDGLYPGLSRSVYVREVRFNQHVSVGAMLLEVGSCGNTTEEAKNGAYYSAKALGTLLLAQTE